MKILVKAVAGSHLFGTNTPQSDKDFKGVFLPSADDILLGKFDQTIHQSTNKEVGQKNTKDDVDIEFYSLDKFLKMLYQGQTVALELLFTPDEFIIECHPLWKEIQADSSKFISKNCKAFIGYTQTQAARYGIRGSRLDTVSKWLEHLKKYPMSSTLEHVIVGDLMNLEHTELMHDKNGKPLVKICGKKFGKDTKLEYIIQPLQRYHDEYGERSKLARQNLGVDFKALSHSIRVSMQAYSLLTTGRIQLPMNNDNITVLKAVKAGEYEYLKVAEMIECYLDDVLEAQEKSLLPEQPNLDNFQYWQKKIYKMIVNNEI